MCALLRGLQIYRTTRSISGRTRSVSGRTRILGNRRIIVERTFLMTSVRICIFLLVLYCT